MLNCLRFEWVIATHWKRNELERAVKAKKWRALNLTEGNYDETHLAA
jgi:hypothetical protein